MPDAPIPTPRTVGAMGGLRGGVAVLAIVIAATALGDPTVRARSPTTTVDSDQPLLAVSPELTVFDSVVVGRSDDRTVRILNMGTSTVTLGDVAVAGDGYSILFDNCSGRDVERDDGCAVTIVFQPPGEGTFTGRISLSEPAEVHGELVGVGVPTPPPTTNTSTTSSAVPTTTIVTPTLPTTSPTTTISPQPTTPPPNLTVAPSVVPTLPPTTSPDQPNNELAQQLAKCEADAAHAEIGFSPDLGMVVGEITDVDVTAAIGGSDVPTPTGTGPSITIVPATLHCKVEATLRGQSFDIDPDEPQAGSFIDQPSMSWTWQVTPTSAGTRRLLLRIVPIAQDQDLQLLGTPVPFEVTITVVAAPRSFWQRVDDFIRALISHPLVSGFGALAAMIATLAAVWRWVLNRDWPWSQSTARRAPSKRARTSRRRSTSRRR